MMRKFIFFEGIIKDTFVFETNHIQRRGNNIEEELTRLMSRRISDEIDNQIVNQLTITANDGNDNLNYLNRWINMGGQRA
jgi:hypothetical protein